MKQIENSQGRGCANNILAITALGLGTWATGNERFNRSLADKGQLNGLIESIEPSFREMVPNMESSEDYLAPDGEDFRRFVKAHGDRSDWKWVCQTALALADVADYQYDTSIEGRVKFMTAMGKITKADIGTSAREMFNFVRATQDIGSRVKWKDEQWRLEAKELVRIVSEETSRVDDLVAKAFLLHNVGVEKGEAIGKLLPEYTELLGTYTFESGMVGSDVTEPLNRLDAEIRVLLEGSGLEPQDLVRMTLPNSNLEKYTDEMEKVQGMLRKSKIIN